MLFSLVAFGKMRGPPEMRHHFVPQFLLRAWSEGANDGTLQEFRIDLEGLPTARRVPKATGFRKDLYALTKLEVAGMSKQAIETNLMSRIDNYAAPVRVKMEQDGLKSLSNMERQDWVRFLMSLKVRQPDVVNQIRMEGARNLRQSLSESPEQYEALAEDDDAPTLEEWAELEYPGLIENFGLSAFPKLVDNGKIGTKILRLRWWIWDFSSAKHELLVSDNPCIFTGDIDAPELIVALPISPTKAFLATRGDRTAERLRQQSPGELVVRLNESSVYQAHERVYARTDAPTRFIANRLKLRT